jgi:hypothetical protein
VPTAAVSVQPPARARPSPCARLQGAHAAPADKKGNSSSSSSSSSLV